MDASGDSDLVYFAGGETMTGRPEDGMSMGCSLEFVLGGVNFEAYKASELYATDPKSIKLIARALQEGKLPYEIDNHLNWWTRIPGRPEQCGMDEIGVCFAHSRRCFPTDNRDLTRMYIEGREQAAILADFIRENVPGFEKSYLSYTGSLLGVRESRRIVGEYVFTGMDIAYARKFDDVIAISQHGFDLHGFEAAGNMKWFKGTLPDGTPAYIANRAGWGSQLPPDDGIARVNMKELIPDEGAYYYDIPFRSLVPVRLENVLAAGRNIYADVPPERHPPDYVLHGAGRGGWNRRRAVASVRLPRARPGRGRSSAPPGRKRLQPGSGLPQAARAARGGLRPVRRPLRQHQRLIAQGRYASPSACQKRF